jgi:hypothetical protein
MNKKLIVLSLCLTALATGAFAFNRQSSINKGGLASGQAKANKSSQPLTNRERSAASLPPQGNAPQVEPVPQAVIYRHLFHHIVMLNQEAQQEELQGNDGSAIRTLYQRLAQLSDEQAHTLDKIATNCDLQVESINTDAKRLIYQYREQSANTNRSQSQPQMASELTALQGQHDAVILQSRDSLHSALGDTEFQRFDQFVQSVITPQFTQSKLSFPQPGSTNTPALQQQ